MTTTVISQLTLNMCLVSIQGEEETEMDCKEALRLLTVRLNGGVGVQLVLDKDPPKSLWRDLLLRRGGGVGGVFFGGNGGVREHLFKLVVFIQLGNLLDLANPCQANCRLIKAESSSSISEKTASSSSSSHASSCTTTIVSSVLSEELLDFQDPNICLCWCNFHLWTDWSAGKKASSKRWCWTYGRTRSHSEQKRRRRRQ